MPIQKQRQLLLRRINDNLSIQCLHLTRLKLVEYKNMSSDSSLYKYYREIAGSTAPILKIISLIENHVICECHGLDINPKNEKTFSW